MPVGFGAVMDGKHAIGGPSLFQYEYRCRHHVPYLNGSPTFSAMHRALAEQEALLVVYFLELILKWSTTFRPCRYCINGCSHKTHGICDTNTPQVSQKVKASQLLNSAQTPCTFNWWVRTISQFFSTGLESRHSYTYVISSMDASDAIPSPFIHSQPPLDLLTQGAEALLYRTHFLTPSHPCALKYRPSKPYRHPSLDKRLTRHRILSEARILVKCRREGVSVPAVLALDAEGSVGGGGGWMIMEWVAGKTVREVMVEGAKRRKEGVIERWEEGVEELMGKIGRAVGRMHEVGIVHGDLTTSNMMLRPGEILQQNGVSTIGERTETAKESLEGEIVLIDFGLAGQSIQDEDKAVDLYVLERAFGSTHPEAEEGFQEVLKVYGESYKGAKVVLKRLEDVRMRGRKRSMLG